MSRPIALANAVTIVWATFYFACGVLAVFAPKIYFGIINSWFHMINLSEISSTTPPTLGALLSGLITFSIFVWVVTYATGWIYQMLVGKK